MTSVDREQSARIAAEFASDWSGGTPPTIQDLFMLGWAREIPELLPMPEGRKLNLGAGKRDIGHAIPLDLERGWNADIDGIPTGVAKGDDIAGIWAVGFFEHLERPVKALAECQRVLQPGGVMNVVTPHALSDCFAKDLYHHHGFTEETWQNLFDNPYYDNAYPDGGGVDWQLDVHACYIMGVEWRNLALFTQLVKRSG